MQCARCKKDKPWSAGTSYSVSFARQLSSSSTSEYTGSGTIFTASRGFQKYNAYRTTTTTRYDVLPATEVFICTQCQYHTTRVGQTLGFIVSLILFGAIPDLGLIVFFAPHFETALPIVLWVTGAITLFIGSLYVWNVVKPAKSVARAWPTPTLFNCDKTVSAERRSAHLVYKKYQAMGYPLFFTRSARANLR